MPSYAQAQHAPESWVALLMLLKYKDKRLRQSVNKNLAIANRSRVTCAHNTPRASMITAWPWNLG